MQIRLQIKHDIKDKTQSFTTRDVPDSEFTARLLPDTGYPAGSPDVEAGYWLFFRLLLFKFSKAKLF